jgi:hypothetical protein
MWLTSQAVRSAAPLGGGAVVTFVLAFWLASAGPEAEVATGASRVSFQSTALPVSEPPGYPSGAAVSPAPALESTEPDTGLDDLVHEKYRFLLEDPALAGEPVAITGALRARERLAVRINTARQDPTATPGSLADGQAELARLDAEVTRLLPAGTHALFRLLSGSDMEQFQVDDFTGGIAGVAPMPEERRRALMLAKLSHREGLRRALDSTGFFGGATREQRRAVLPAVLQALEQSHHGFLQEAGQQLTTEQFELLRNYENSEYTAELAKLRAQGG